MSVRESEIPKKCEREEWKLCNDEENADFKHGRQHQLRYVQDK